ncbi:MAG: phenylacetate--CoA ligase, partial [Methanomassiliicoccales archaeon]|nr:phenylacetate--CoA ligase [Methanomassiliicoccales archaeon]
MDVWNPHIEKLPKAQLDALQLKLLKIQTRRMWEFSPFYRERMRSAGVTPDDIRTLKDVRKLPFMTKKDLRDGYPDKLMMRDRGDLLRYHASSGTTGKATIVGYTKNDLENWSESLARAMTSFGLGRKDVIQVANTYGLFSGGLGFHYATEKIGATVVPASTGNTDRQLELICDLGVTAMAATPSYLMYLGEVAEKKGIDIRRDTKLRFGLLGGEPWSDRMRDRIYEKLGIRGFNCFGASELSGPLFMECAEQDGIHFWGDLALLEIVDPETGEPLEPGQKGEMVVTMLQKEAFPMMRYRMGDITSIMAEPCPCGRAHPRITRIQGRVDDMIIIRGINVFPSQVEHSLMQHPELGNEFQLVVDRKGHLD